MKKTRNKLGDVVMIDGLWYVCIGNSSDRCREYIHITVDGPVMDREKRRIKLAAEEKHKSDCGFYRPVSSASLTEIEQMLKGNQ